MKGKTKGNKNNKNKSIKKNLIPAFMLTGGDLDNYNNYVNDTQKDYKGAMDFAVEQVENKMKNCTDENEILQDIAKKEKLNKDNLITKLNELNVKMINLKQSKKQVTDLQTQMDTCNKEKDNLQTRINDLNSQNEQLTKTNDDITRISDSLKIAQELAAKEASDAKDQAEKEAIAAQELAESKKLSTENEAKPYATDFMSEIIPKASEKPKLIGELEKKIKLFEEEKIVLNDKIVENKQIIDNLELEHRNLKEIYEQLQIEHKTCTNNLQQLKDEHEATFNKLLQLVNSTNIDNLSDEDKKALGDKDNQITNIINAINGKLTGVKEQQEEQHNKDTNKKITEVEEKCNAKIEEMKTGKSNELGGINIKITEQTQKLESLIDGKKNAEEMIEQGKDAQETVNKAQNDLEAIKLKADEAQQTIEKANELETRIDAASKALQEELKQKNELNNTLKQQEEALKKGESEVQTKCNEQLAAAEQEKKNCDEALKLAKTENDTALAAAEQAKTEKEEALTAAEQAKTVALAEAEEDCEKRISAAQENAIIAGRARLAKKQEEEERLAAEAAQEEEFEEDYKLDQNSIEEFEEDMKINKIEKLIDVIPPSTQKIKNIEKYIETKQISTNDTFLYIHMPEFENIKDLQYAGTSVLKPRYFICQVNRAGFNQGEDIDFATLNMDCYEITNIIPFTEQEYTIDSVINAIKIKHNKKITETEYYDIGSIPKKMTFKIAKKSMQTFIHLNEKNQVLTNKGEINVSKFTTFTGDNISLKDNKNIISMTKLQPTTKKVRDNLGLEEKFTHPNNRLKYLKAIIIKNKIEPTLLDIERKNKSIINTKRIMGENLKFTSEASSLKKNIKVVYPFGEESFTTLYGEKREKVNGKTATIDKVKAKILNYSSNVIIFLNTTTTHDIHTKNLDNNLFHIYAMDNELKIRFTKENYKYISDMLSLHLSTTRHQDKDYKNVSQMNLFSNFDNIEQPELPKEKPYVSQYDSADDSVTDPGSVTVSDDESDNSFPSGGKKNLTKYKGKMLKKGGYRYSALGMKGLTIDLSGMKAKKTRRVKKKGKTAKNKKGSRKNKKGSRKNKRRGRTYRNKK
jgi:hypothetical protein